MKHTPGPWERWDDGIKSIGDSIDICRVYAVPADDSTQYGSGESDANARLIAAAPDLLESCVELEKAYRELLEAYGEAFGWGYLPADTAAEAIAKATT